MPSYRLTDRLKEKSSAAGVLIAVLGAVLPVIVPPEHLTAWITAANAAVGLFLALMPESNAAKDVQAVAQAIQEEPRMVEAARLARGEDPTRHG